jgi:DNA-binding CsgD family transcriptional regulator
MPVVTKLLTYPRPIGAVIILRMRKNIDNKRIFALRRQGRTLKEIARVMGLAPSTVRDRLLQSGKFPGRVRLRSHFPPEKARVIFSLYNKGYSLRQIGAVIGYSYETVRTVLNNKNRYKRR